MIDKEIAKCQEHVTEAEEKVRGLSKASEELEELKEQLVKQRIVTAMRILAKKNLELCNHRVIHGRSIKEQWGIFPKGRIKLLYRTYYYGLLGKGTGLNYAGWEGGDLVLLCPEHYPARYNVFEQPRNPRQYRGKGDIVSAVEERDGRLITSVEQIDVTSTLISRDLPEGVIEYLGIPRLPDILTTHIYKHRYTSYSFDALCFKPYEIVGKVRLI